MFTFHAMGTEVAVSAPGLADHAERALAERVAAIFADEEQRFSRFRDDSELSRLNVDEGEVAVSPDMLDALVRARFHAASTDGAFDPAIGAALVAHGYDRSFAPGALDRDTEATSTARARFGDVVIDEVKGTIRRPAHVRIDLGGMIKGRTVDRAAALLPSPAFIDAGGDALLVGTGPDPDGWTVDVEDPENEESVLLSLRVRDRAVATSSPNRRRWTLAGAPAHHLIDPRTQRPARSDLAQVTVLAARVETAEVLAKSAFVLGARDGRALLERMGASAVLVRNDGGLELVGVLELHDA